MKALLSAITVAAVLVLAASAAAEPPHNFLGTWTRTVTANDVARAGSKKVKAGQTWTLVIGKQSSTARYGKLLMRGDVVPTNASQVNIELGQQKPNLYDWRRSGAKLTFKARAESVADRKAVLDGTWTKRTK